MLDIQKLKNSFFEQFGSFGDTRIFFAPGRVNLIGEHTDYCGGYVFPAAISLGTWAVVKPRNDGLYRFRSTNFPVKADIHISDELTYRIEDDWANYPKGVLVELLKLASKEESIRFTGADMLFSGTLPNGAGLSSSASIEMVSALSISKLAEMDINMIELAKLSQRAENLFVGVNCGILDQFAVGMGRRNHAVLLKCDTLDYEYVPFEIENFKLVITNTNKKRGLVESKYNQRRKECEIGLETLQKETHIKSLGDLSYPEWKDLKQQIKNDVIRNRVEHVISENKRVLEAKGALENSNLIKFGTLMVKSHNSLRYFYEVTGKELDTLFEEALKIEGCIGSRMTGAGFGGCTISLVRNETFDEFKAIVSENYKKKTGLTPDFYVCEIGSGAKEIDKEL